TRPSLRGAGPEQVTDFLPTCESFHCYGCCYGFRSLRPREPRSLPLHGLVRQAGVALRGHGFRVTQDGLQGGQATTPLKPLASTRPLRDTCSLNAGTAQDLPGGGRPAGAAGDCAQVSLHWAVYFGDPLRRGPALRMIRQAANYRTGHPDPGGGRENAPCARALPANLTSR